MDIAQLEDVSIEGLQAWLDARQAAAREALAVYNAAAADLQRGYRVLTRRLCRPPTPPAPAVQEESPGAGS
jgi:hypothetical protein